MAYDFYSHVKKDQMTPKERDAAVKENRPYDRIQCGLFMGEHSAKLIGAKVSELHLNIEKSVDAHIAARKIYDNETAGVGPGLPGIAEAFGSRLEFPDYNTPYISDFAVKEYSDADRLEIPDPNKDGRLPFFLETNKRLVEALGKEVNISSFVGGPFTTAANLRGAEKFLRDTYRSPEFAHRLLRLSTDATIAYVKEAAKLGIGFSIADPTASGTLISESHFAKFAFPYLKELTDAIIEYSGSAPSLHICGNSKKIWSLMVQTGAEALSIDNEVDLEEAKIAVGTKVKLIGNIKPTETMFLGTPQDVDKNARECLRKAFDNPKGYVLALGCGLPNDTPPENIHALLYAARKYGQYPLDPALFS